MNDGIVDHVLREAVINRVRVIGRLTGLQGPVIQAFSRSDTADTPFLTETSSMSNRMDMPLNTVKYE